MSQLYIPTIDLPIQRITAGNMCADPGNILIVHRHMNVEIGTEVAQFPEKKYINRIFVAVCGWVGNRVFLPRFNHWNVNFVCLVNYNCIIGSIARARSQVLIGHFLSFALLNGWNWSRTVDFRIVFKKAPLGFRSYVCLCSMDFHHGQIAIKTIVSQKIITIIYSEISIRCFLVSHFIFILCSIHAKFWCQIGSNREDCP